MTLGTNDVQTTSLKHLVVALGPFGLGAGNFLFGGAFHTRHFKFPVTTQHNIRTTAGHVGGNGDCTRATGLGNDLGLTLMLFGVQDLVVNPRLLEQHGQKLRGLN